MSAPNPKRLRQTGSFSPASPPYYAGAKISQSTFSPHTPTSPQPPKTPMTSATQTYATSHSSLTSNSQPQTVASTPASSVHGPSQHHKPSQNDIDVDMDDLATSSMTEDALATAPLAAQQPDADVVMLEQDDHRFTNHERDNQRYSEQAEGSQVKPRQAEQSFYKLCQYSHPSQRPHPSQDLLSLYGLGDLYQSLRRWKPDGLTKDVKLRKSYGAYLKNLPIAGKNEALEQPETFTPRLTDYPADEWFAQNVSGRSIGLNADLKAKIEAAMQMTRGALPQPRQKPKSKDKDDLGDKDVMLKVRHLLDPGEKKKEIKPVAAQVAGVASRVPSATNSPMHMARRPDRQGKKRSYQDDSFTGYGDGYDDDDPLSTAEDGHGLKRRKKS